MRRIELDFRLNNPILACGADVKSAFALGKDKEVFLFDGFGDLGELDNFTRYEKAVEAAEKRLKVRPKIIACDLHPGYFSTRFAEHAQHTKRNTQLYKIQHHEAHIAGAILDNSVKGEVIGVAFDGTGLGVDGNIWGGEFFVGCAKSFKRTGHFEYIPMPGADCAAKEPWRMAASYLYKVCGKAGLRSVDKKERLILKKMIDKKINSPLTSSAGRLFDAVGSIVLSKDKVSKEAELPMELERIADRSCGDIYGFDVRGKDGMSVIDVSKTIRSIIKDVSKKIPTPIISAKFHNTVACIILEMASRLRSKFGIDKVVLSGGVFQNRFLTARALDMLKQGGFKVYMHSMIPTNDSGIPIGQIAIANARAVCA